jgi:hypothetical protein
VKIAEINDQELSTVVPRSFNTDPCVVRLVFEEVPTTLLLSDSPPVHFVSFVEGK